MELKISQNFSIDANDIVTNRSCIIGQSGSGKSYSVAVICEELLRNHIGFTIIDTEGEYFSLKQKFNIIWVGKDEQADFDIDSIDLSDFAKKVIKDRLPVIFDISEVRDPKSKVKEYLTALYEIEDKVRTPYLIIIEEADKFIPQRGKRLDIVDEIARRGRKRGLGLLIATQRPSIVNKDILSQCAIPIIGKLKIENDIKAVSIFFDNKKDLMQLPNLSPGEFFINGKLIKFRKRITKHEAVTPKVIPWKFEKIEVEKPKLLGVPPKEHDGKLIWIPIIEVKTKLFKKGLLGTQVQSKTIYVYGNKMVRLAPLKEILDISHFKKLSKEEIETFIKMRDGSTIKDIARTMHISENTARRHIKKLVQEGLLRETNEKPIHYSKLTKLDVNKLFSKEVEKEEVNATCKKAEVEDIKQFMKSIGLLTEDINVICYPIYKIEKSFLGKKYIKYIDGPSGKKVNVF